MSRTILARNVLLGLAYDIPRMVDDRMSKEQIIRVLERKVAYLKSPPARVSVVWWNEKRFVQLPKVDREAEMLVDELVVDEW